MNLSRHFTLEEFTRSETAAARGIDNTPPPEIVTNLQRTAAGMELVRAQVLRGLPITLTSGYRCEALERIIARKGYLAWLMQHRIVESEAAWRSYFATKGHPQGWCGDWVCPQFGTPREIVKAIVALHIPFDQCIEEGNWVHTSFDPRMRGITLTAHFDAQGRPSYTQGVA